jgi:hypothetical protein
MDKKIWWTPSYGKITIWDGYRVSVVLALWSEVNDHNHLATHDLHHTLPTFKKKKKKILTVRLFDKKQKFIHGYFHISNGILLQTFFLQLDKDFLFLYCIMYVFKNVHVHKTFQWVFCTCTPKIIIQSEHLIYWIQCADWL